jgi:hypothetical protein
MNSRYTNRMGRAESRFFPKGSVNILWPRVQDRERRLGLIPCCSPGWIAMPGQSPTEKLDQCQQDYEDDLSKIAQSRIENVFTLWVGPLCLHMVVLLRESTACLPSFAR